MHQQTAIQRDYTARDISKLLGVTVHKVYDLINSGALGHYKVSPRGTRITQNQLDLFRNNGGVT